VSEGEGGGGSGRVAVVVVDVCEFGVGVVVWREGRGIGGRRGDGERGVGGRGVGGGGDGLVVAGTGDTAGADAGGGVRGRKGHRVQDGRYRPDDVQLDHCPPEYAFFTEGSGRVQSLELAESG